MLLSVPFQWVQRTRFSPLKEKASAWKGFVGKITRECEKFCHFYQ